MIMPKNKIYANPTSLLNRLGSTLFAYRFFMMNLRSACWSLLGGSLTATVNIVSYVLRYADPS